MKIAVIAVGYQCKSLASVLSPWISLKNGIKDDFGNIFFNKPKNIEIKICCVSALFKERQDGGEIYENIKNRNLFSIYKEQGSIDEFIEEKSPIFDYQSRNIALDYFRKNSYNFDYAWQLDLFDEFYTKEEILNTLNWIENNEGHLYEYFRINFKNYIGDKIYVKDFSPVRILNNKRNNGIKEFYFDNDIIFNNGIKTPNCAGRTIPIKICNPKHLSWVGDKEFLINKIEYQRKAIGTCSYKYNSDKNQLEFNIEEYYKRFNIPIPETFKDE